MWIFISLVVLIAAILVVILSCYYCKNHRQSHTSAEAKQLTEMTDTHMRSSGVSNYSVYQEIGQDIPAQLEAPRPPARRPDQTIDTGIYLTQAEAGADTCLLERYECN